MSRNERIIRLCIPVLFVALSIFLLGQIHATENTERVYQGLSPFSVPRVIIWLILAMSVVDIVKDVAALIKNGGFGKDAEKGEAIVPLPALIAVVTLAVYVFLWKYIGFTLSTAIYVAGIGKYLRRNRPWWECAIVGVVFAIAMYLLFVELFAVMLPDPLVDLIRY